MTTDNAIAALDPASDWARAFVCRDPALIPPREFVYDRHYACGFISTTSAPGGHGKSALVMAEALAIASGKPLLGITPMKRTRVWYWNGEDPLEEVERRFAALMLEYKLEPSEVEGWLFYGSGRDAELIVVQQGHGGTTINAPHVEALTRMIKDLEIGVAIIDPFISAHRVTENDNAAIDRVAKTFAKTASDTGAAIELVHHTRKRPPGSAEVTVEDSRGAVALLAAARSARVLNSMSESEAGKAGVTNREAYLRATIGKSNLSPAGSGSRWYRLVGVPLGNGPDGGDNVGVIQRWEWPDHAAGVSMDDLLAVQRAVKGGNWRKDAQAKEWVGFAIAECMNLKLANPVEKARVKVLVRQWLENGTLAVVSRADAKGMVRDFVEVGELATICCDNARQKRQHPHPAPRGVERWGSEDQQQPPPPPS